MIGLSPTTSRRACMHVAPVCGADTFVLGQEACGFASTCSMSAPRYLAIERE